MKKTIYMIGAAVAVLITAVAAFAAMGYVPDPVELGTVIFGAGAIGGMGLVGGGATSAGQAPANAPLPFRYNTRQKFSKVGTMTYALGGTSFLTLPKVGYLSKIYIRFTGTISSTNTITYAKFGPWSILRNINFNLNSGKQILCDVSGYELFLHNMTTKKSARTDQNADADFYAAPTASAAGQAFSLTWEVPIAVSDGHNFAVGLINLQAPELQANLQLQFNTALADVGSNLSAIAGTFYVSYEYYEVPDPTRVAQPPVVLHKILSQPYAIASTGENRFEVPRGGRLLRYIEIVELNGAKSDSYDNKKIFLNKTQEIAVLDRPEFKFRNRRDYGFVMPTGVSCWDFQKGWDLCEESDLRDALDTEAVTTTEMVTTVTSGATLGSNNNFVHSVREILQIPV
jgi:hypothetical protein